MSRFVRNCLLTVGVLSGAGAANRVADPFEWQPENYVIEDFSARWYDQDGYRHTDGATNALAIFSTFVLAVGVGVNFVDNSRRRKPEESELKI